MWEVSSGRSKPLVNSPGSNWMRNPLKESRKKRRRKRNLRSSDTNLISCA